MKFHQSKALPVIVVCLLLHTSAALALRGKSVEEPQWGKTSDGLQMSISAVESGRDEAPKFRVAFRNVGGQDLNLYLGFVGGAGPRPCNLAPTPKAPCQLNIALNVTDAAGRARRLEFGGIYYVAGRLDPAIVWLRAGSTFAFEIGLDQFYSPDTKEYRLTLAPGRNQIRAEFEGRSPQVVNLDQQHLKEMSYWVGKLQSNTLEVER